MILYMSLEPLSLTAVQLRVVDFQLVTRVNMIIVCINRRMKLRNKNSLHRSDSDDLQNPPKAVWQVQTSLRNVHEQICTNGRSDLNTNAIERCAVKPAQSQLLFDPTKEQLDGPASAIYLSNDQRIEVELVGHKNQHVAGLRIDKADASKRVGVVLAANDGIELDSLVAAQAGGLVHGATLHYVKAGVRLEARDEKSPGLVQTIQTGKIHVTAVHNVVTARIHRYVVERGHFVLFPLVQAGKNRDIPAKIEQHVRLDRGQGSLPSCPRKQRRAQLDYRGIQGEQVGFQSKCRRAVGGKSLCATHQERGDVGEN